MAKAKPTEDVPLAVALREAHDWCVSATFQGARLTDLLEHQVAFDHANAMAAEWRALRAANVLPGGARVEVVESFFFLTSLRVLLLWLAQVRRRGHRPPRDIVVAAKAFAEALPAPVALRRILENEYRLGETDLPDFDPRVDGGEAWRAAKARDYVLPGGVNLPATMAALRTLGAALGPVRETARRAEP